MEAIGSDEQVPEKSISREKRWLLFVYTPLVFVAMFTLGIIFEDSHGASRTFDVIGTLALNILAFAWCRFDSNERGYKLHRLFPYAVVIFGTLALLYYIFRSRGFRGGLNSTGWLVLYVVCCAVVSFIVVLAILLVLVLSGAVSEDIFNE